MSFRRLQRADFPLLLGWESQAHVTPYWGPPPDQARLESEYGPAIDGAEPTEIFLAEHDGKPVGLVQRYKNRDHPDWDVQIKTPDAAGIDYYIGEPDLIGQGVGPELIAAFVDQLFSDWPDIEHVVVGVLQENRRSWRALEKAGFERIRPQFLESEDPWDRGPGYVYSLTPAD
jgi:aminoglycoside 6'-N-acetyltransferase